MLGGHVQDGANHIPIPLRPIGYAVVQICWKRYADEMTHGRMVLKHKQVTSDIEQIQTMNSSP